MNPQKLTADIQAYSALAQVAIALGKLAGDQIKDFVQWLRARNGEPPMSNETLDAITTSVLAEDTRRKALADAEAAG